MGFGRSLRHVTRRITRTVSRAVSGIGRTARKVVRNVGRVATSPVGGAIIGASLAPVTGGMSLGAMAAAGAMGAAKGYAVSSALGSLKRASSGGDTGYDFSSQLKKTEAEEQLEMDRALSATNLRKKYGTTYGSGYTSRWGKVIK